MKSLVLLIFTVTLLFSCGGELKSEGVTNEGSHSKEIPPKNLSEGAQNADSLKADIETLIAFFASQKSKELDKAKASELVEKTQHFVAAFPDDPNGGGYLFMAGEVSRALKRYEDAINIFTKVESDYPEHEKAAAALFLKAFTYEENLRNTDFAKKYYQEFLSKYPNHELTEEVKKLLAVVDLSPEELIKRFKEQNKE